MLIAFVHFFAELIIALILLRLGVTWAADRLGPDHPFVAALAFIS